MQVSSQRGISVDGSCIRGSSESVGEVPGIVGVSVDPLCFVEPSLEVAWPAAALPLEAVLLRLERPARGPGDLRDPVFRLLPKPDCGPLDTCPPIEPRMPPDTLEVGDACAIVVARPAAGTVPIPVVPNCCPVRFAPDLGLFAVAGFAVTFNVEPSCQIPPC